MRQQPQETPWQAPHPLPAGNLLDKQTPQEPVRDGDERDIHPSLSPQSNNSSKRVLVVDDEQLIADTLARILNVSGFLAQAVYSGEAALELAPSLCPDIVLTDIRMPGRNGIDTAVLIQQLCPQTRIVLFSGQAGVGDLMERARNNGHGFELWSKPIHPRELIKRLHEL